MIMKNIYATVVPLWRAILKSTWAKAFFLAIMWQTMMLLMGILFEKTFNAAPARVTFFSHMVYWDAGWYQLIADKGGYAINPAAPVFYPIFPMLVKAVEILSFKTLAFGASGLIVNTISLGFAIKALTDIGKIFVGEKFKYFPLIIFITSPAAVFLHLNYAEAIFCAVGFWAYLFALKKQWAYMGIMLAIATAIRMPSVLFIALCGLEYLRAHNWSVKKSLGKSILWFLLAPLGFIIYGIYLKLLRGDFLAMLHGYKATNDWTYHIFNPNIFDTIYKSITASYDTLFGPTTFHFITIVNHTLPLIALTVIFTTSLYMLLVVRGRGIPLGIFGLLSIVLFSLNSNIVSVHRYTLPVLTIYLAASVFVKKHNVAGLPLAVIILGNTSLQTFLFILFLSSRFAG